MTWFILYVLFTGVLGYILSVAEVDTSRWSTSYLVFVFFISMLLGWILFPINALIGLVKLTRN